jgi:hypothetical protein
MKVLLAFLIVAFLLGGSRFGRRVRERPVVLLAFCTVVAASYYSLQVIG